jgi:hypothetical protein
VVNSPALCDYLWGVNTKVFGTMMLMKEKLHVKNECLPESKGMHEKTILS